MTVPRAFGVAPVLLFALASGTHGLQPEAELLLQNVRVFDVDRATFSDPLALRVRGGRVDAVGALDPPGESVRRLDLAGAYALPGLWDSHVHVSPATLGGRDPAEVLERFVRSGVLHVRDMGGPLDVIGGLSRKVASGALVGPGICFAGPMAERPPL